MNQKIKKTFKKQLWRIPKELKLNQINLKEEQLEELRLSIHNNYHIKKKPIDKDLEIMLQKDMDDHLVNRLENDRMRIIPWLNSIKQIKQANILEIGCGTGSSTLALAEQGAIVTGIDVDEGALQVAKDRLRITHQKADFHVANATELKKLFSHKSFDFIIFFACLEHMTIEERIISLRDVWSMLQTSSYMVVIESPNRLWYHDSHTSLLPFFNWLPDELAFMYSKYSSRIGFNDQYREINEKNMMHFLRRGRGISFHEFEISIKNVEDLNIVSSLDGFENINIIKYTRRQLNYISFLRNLKKGLPKEFCYPDINLIIKKD
ncbi:MAG: class I SAM-dependent methyltransferase [Bacteroidales bacterium]|nr:class I SAM-dependent methyltransferase [Bacteroidales bacterium]